MTLLSATTDLDDKTSVLHSSRLRLDHCDLLLDALDAQLDQLQVCYFHSVCLTVSFFDYLSGHLKLWAFFHVLLFYNLS